MVKEGEKTPEQRDELLQMANNLFHEWKRMPDIYSDDVSNKYRRNWFSAIIGLLSILIEEEHVTKSRKDVLRNERDLLSRDVNRVTTGLDFIDTNLPGIKRKEGTMGLITTELVDRGDELLKKVIVLLEESH